MMKKTRLTIGAITVALALSVTGCKKEEPDADTSAGDHAISEAHFTDIHHIADEAAYNGTLNAYKTGEEGGILGNCATLTFDTLSSPRLITVDFGSINCLCKDQRQRRGKIEISFTGKYTDPGTVITITPKNYFVNENEVKGTKTITNKGRNTAGNLSWDVSVSGTIVLAENNKTITWKSNRSREWIAGESTPLIWTDDVYQITGGALGTNASGVNFEINVILALRRPLSCRYFTSGTLHVRPEGKKERSIDYGDGTCDNQATISIGDKVHRFTLP